MVGEVVGGVQRRHERKWTLGRVPLSFVVDVVKDQTVETQRTKPSDCRVGDLLGAFTIRRKARRGESKEEELALAGIDSADQIHGRDGSGIAEGPLRRGQDARGTTKARPAARGPLVVLLATSGADDAGGLNAVVTVGLAALLLPFPWRGYADPAPRVRPAPRFDAARGTSAEIGPDLLLASLEHLGVVDDDGTVRVVVLRPWFPKEQAHEPLTWFPRSAGKMAPRPPSRGKQGTETRGMAPTARRGGSALLAAHRRERGHHA